MGANHRPQDARELANQGSRARVEAAEERRQEEDKRIYWENYLRKVLEWTISEDSTLVSYLRNADANRETCMECP
jgi:hypothetical protein